jgi:Aspartyl protease
VGFCFGGRDLGRASTSRVQSLRSAWTRVLAVCGSAALAGHRTTGLLAVVATVLLSWTPLLSLETVAEVPFELYQHHLIVTKGSIGPLNGLSLLIDTGTIPSMVDGRIVRKLHVQAEPSVLVAFGQSVAIQSTILNGFRIGARQPGPVPAGVSDLSYLEGVRIDAIVGLDVLARTSFSIDYRKRVLRFSPDGREESVAPLELAWPFLTVQMTIGGQQVRLLVDTGSSDLVLFKSRMPAALSRAPWRGDKTVQYASGAARLQRLDLRQVRLGARVWDKLTAWALDRALDGYSPSIDGVLGVLALECQRVHFDFKRNELGCSP